MTEMNEATMVYVVELGEYAQTMVVDAYASLELAQADHPGTWVEHAPGMWIRDDHDPATIYGLVMRTERKPSEVLEPPAERPRTD